MGLRADRSQSCGERGRLDPALPRPLSPVSAIPHPRAPFTCRLLWGSSPNCTWGSPCRIWASLGLAEGRPSGGGACSSDWLVCSGSSGGCSGVADAFLPTWLLPLEQNPGLHWRGAPWEQGRRAGGLLGGPAPAGPWPRPAPCTRPTNSTLFLVSAWYGLAFTWRKNFTKYRESKRR